MTDTSPGAGVITQTAKCDMSHNQSDWHTSDGCRHVLDTLLAIHLLGFGLRYTPIVKEESKKNVCNYVNWSFLCGQR